MSRTEALPSPEDVAGFLQKARQRGRTWEACCPAHDDTNPSLTLSTGNNGLTLWKCHSQKCSQEAVQDALFDLGAWPHRSSGAITATSRSVSSTPVRRSEPAPAVRPDAIDWNNPVDIYPYHDEEGKLLYDVRRLRVYRPDGTEGREFRPYLPGKSKPGLPATTRRVLYRLPGLLDANPGTFVYVTEGEKDANNVVERLGLVAICNQGGAIASVTEANRTQWEQVFANLAGLRVIVLTDNDEPGRKHGANVASLVFPVASSVAILALPGLPDKGDVSDWIAAGGTAEELTRLAGEAEAWTPSRTLPSLLSLPSPSEGNGFVEDHSLRSFPAQPRAQVPVLAEGAYHGLAGEVVRLIDPSTEASPSAVLLQFIVAFGNACGPRPHLKRGSETAYTREYCLIVGKTGTGRKGTSWTPVRELMTLADGVWSDRIREGLSTGEGLISFVADNPAGESEPALPADRRLLLVEAEFSTPLRRARREGNTLGGILRSAWDSGTLGTITRSNSMRATNAHISIIGHITAAELIKETTAVDAQNGFLNRIIFGWATRSKSLPHPPVIDADGFQRLAVRIRVALDKARASDALSFDTDAYHLWADIYGSVGDGGLSDHGDTDEDDDTGSLLDLVVHRRESHCLRLAVIYALLDGSVLIRREHIAAAVELWWYSEQTAAKIFGDAMGDGVAQRIMQHLNDVGESTRTEISQSLSNHVERSRMDASLASLRRSGRVLMGHAETAGRRAEVWRVNPDAPSGNASRALPRWLTAVRS